LLSGASAILRRVFEGRAADGDKEVMRGQLQTPPSDGMELSMRTQAVPRWNSYMPMGASRVQQRANDRPTASQTEQTPQAERRQMHGALPRAGGSNGRYKIFRSTAPADGSPTSPTPTTAHTLSEPRRDVDVDVDVDGAGGGVRRVVYLPTCVTRMMGPAASDAEGSSGGESVHEVMMRLMDRAGYEVVTPKGLEGLCCGMLFDSRGFQSAGATKSTELQEALLAATEGGMLPVVVDTSPCLKHLKEVLDDERLRQPWSLYEPVQFIEQFLSPHLQWQQVKDEVCVHVPCSSKQLQLEPTFIRLAEKCAGSVVPSNVPCCGMAGDRGMRYPELTDGSLQHLDVGCASDGYSTSRTCEISLSHNSGIRPLQGKGNAYTQKVQTDADSGLS